MKFIYIQENSCETVICKSRATLPWFQSVKHHHFAKCKLYSQTVIKYFEIFQGVKKSTQLTLVFREWYNIPINPLWPSDDIWHHRTWSTLVQVLACCTKPLPEPMLDQFQSLGRSRSCGIHIMPILQEILITSICKMSLKIIFLKLLLHVPGENELKQIGPHSDCFVINAVGNEGCQFDSLHPLR